MAHTPGPWYVDFGGDCRLAIMGPNERVIAFGAMENEDGDIDEANCRLIAAAPLLLEALEYAYVQIKQDNAERGATGTLTETMIRAALTAASGE